MKSRSCSVLRDTPQCEELTASKSLHKKQQRSIVAREEGKTLRTRFAGRNACRQGKRHNQDAELEVSNRSSTRGAIIAAIVIMVGGVNAK